MPRKERLLWDTSQKVWFKYYIDPTTSKRRKLYLGKAKSRTNDPESYKKALDKWTLFALNALGAELTPARQAKFDKRQQTNKVEPEHKYPKDSVAYAAHLYIERFTWGQYKANEISHHTYKLRKSSLKYVMEKFIKSPGTFQGSATGFGINRQFTDLRMMRLYEFFRNAVRVRQDISYATARTRHGSFKRFVAWCWENNYLDKLPRNLMSPDLVLKKEKPRGGNARPNLAVTFTPDELSRLFETASTLGTIHPVTLYLLIAINTGMSFIDIGTLKFSQIEYDGDGMPYAIERARSKTGNSGYWKLWATTSKLLHEHLQIRNKFATQAGESSGFDKEPWVFLQLDPNRRTMLRQPLMYSIHYKSPSHYKHSNTLGMLMIRIKKLSRVKKKMKHLRSTAATSIRSISNNDLLLTQMFLAHSPKTVAEKHYASPTNFEDLFRCIDVMYSELGIDKLEHFIEAGNTHYKENWKWL